jgi:hypothetical protein
MLLVSRAHLDRHMHESGKLMGRGEEIGILSGGC